jgi:hypothetical protein
MLEAFQGGVYRGVKCDERGRGQIHYQGGFLILIGIHHAEQYIDQQVWAVFQADLPKVLGDELLGDDFLDPRPQGRFVVSGRDLSPSVRHPRMGKGMKRREVDGLVEIRAYLDLVPLILVHRLQLRAASGGEHS